MLKYKLAKINTYIQLQNLIKTLESCNFYLLQIQRMKVPTYNIWDQEIVTKNQSFFTKGEFNELSKISK